MQTKILKKLILLFLVTTALSSQQILSMQNYQKNTVIEQNKFACNLYAKLSQKKGNTFFSPYSISTALNMVYAGAKGDTRKEIANVLQINLSKKQAPLKVAELLNNFNSNRPKHSDRSIKSNELDNSSQNLKWIEYSEEKNKNKISHKLVIANKIFIQKYFKILPSFQSTINANYGATFDSVDFVNHPEEAVKTINNWVAKKTKNKIKQIVKRGCFTRLTRLVLANAIYFKGRWEKPFLKQNTELLPFYLNGKKKTIDVPMMRQTNNFKYMENENLQILELPYKNSSLSMFIILPKEKNDLTKVEKTINLETSFLEILSSRLRPQKVNVLLPKFKLETEYKLKDHLIEMGMPLAFSSKANFNGITGEKDLYISKVLHKAFVEIKEEGTEAAATTAVIMQTKSCFRLPVESTIFNANHPFIFIIRDNRTKLNLFMGRMISPNTYITQL